jgi:hypothetical protein
MTECSRKTTDNATTQLNFGFLPNSKITLDFQGGTITSDAGLLLLRQIDQHSGLCARLAAAFVDRRDQRYISHDLLDLLRQRVYQIAAGYEDCNDADQLRCDPVLKASAAGRRPEEDDLASQPTLSRLENSLNEYDLERLLAALVEHYLDQRGQPEYLLLDIDPTDDACHGHQQMALFHGYYDEKIYHDLLLFDGDTGSLIMPVLRPGSVHGADGLVETLAWLLPRLRQRFPETTIIVRGDGGLASPRLYKFLEAAGCFYVIGVVTNPRLVAHNANNFKRAQQLREMTGRIAQVFTEFEYQAASWTRPRRVIGKAELLDKGPNQRFVVTNLVEGSAAAIYDFYRQRGEAAENRIKEWKTYVKADRLSCHGFWANWLRMILHTVAYELLRLLKQELAGTELARATVETLRLKLIKVGARVVASVRRLWIHCASGYPYQHLWRLLQARLPAT